MDNAIRVSIAELLEVRSDGLYTPELLSIIVGACEHLRRVDKSGVFNTDYIFFAPNGKIEITLVSAAHLAEESLPPELRDHIDEDDRLGVREPQMVWCLGDVIRQSCAQACSDAELFSLLNLMTVAHIGTRPTLAKLGQMTRNRCAAAGIDVNGVLKALYEELMGDIDELVDDSTSLSGWSEVNGHGPKDPKQPSPSTSHSDEDVDEDEDDDGNETDDAEERPATTGYRTYLPPVQEEENNYKQATKVVRRDSDEESTMTAATLSSNEKDESRKGSISSVATLKSASSEEEDGEKTPKRRPSSPEEEFERVITPIAEEPETPQHTPPPQKSIIESSPFLISQKLQQQQQQEKENTVIIQKESKSTELPQSPFVAEMTQSPFISVKKATTPPPSPRNVLPSKISEEESDLDETDLPPPRSDLPPSPKLIPKSTSNTGAGVVSARKKSSIASIEPQKGGIPETLPAQVQPRQVSSPFEEEEGKLSRHNSLGPSKVLRRSSRTGAGGKSAAFATPEFVEKQTLAVIRLQAQSSRKKRLSLVRVEPTFVLVKIVNGQTVEVNCKSDAYVGSVFDSVVEYFNVPEHTYFGLAVIRDGEFFFLDNEQRLEKYSPPGWKGAKKGNQEKYMLYLRFRYYPKKLEFIKTPTTTHSLYLQLRQDILHDSLKPKRDKLFELAALALQAEFGDSKMPKMGAKVPYFKVQHYLPPRAFVDQDAARVENNLIEIHSHYSGQASILSERQFIELCQSEADYGAHYYRVYKFKPSTSSSFNNSNQMSNDIFKIAILPDGLGICSSQGGSATLTVITQFHPWHMIRTLQFDRKRFLIATIENGLAQDHVFYTDHYTKSGYLVKFAASQHRFMMKMRHWQYTLTRDRQGIKDVAIERSSIEVAPEDDGPKEIVFATMPKRSQPAAEKQPTMGISQSRSEETPRRGTAATTVSTTTTQSTAKNPFEDAESEDERDGGPQRIQLKIILEKDPSTGLGLTLVDGAVEDIKGVYVKSVSNDGDAKRKGIEKGDCIQAINGISLVDKTRHDAVELVKQSGREVELDIMRFPCITQILGHERQASKEEIIGSSTNGSAGTNNNNGGFRKAPPSKNELLVGKRPSVSRTPPANRKVTPSSKNIRQRAASDFGAIGDALPVLKSEDLLAGFEKARRRTHSNSGSDESEGEAQRGEYRLPVTSIYNFHASEDEDEDAGKPSSNNHGNGSTNYPLDDTTSWVSKSTMESAAQKSVQSYPQRQNLDWTNELSDIEDSPDNFGSDMQRLQINIHRAGTKTLGFQVASGGGFVSVKGVTSDPALSAGLKVDDRIVAINGRPTNGMTHSEVVDTLKAERSPIIQLTVDRLRPPGEKEQTISVSLEKSHNTPLGLSLAKRMGREGIYIRNIAAGSIADKDGRLKQGDKIWEVDGENVADESANSIVEKLKTIEGRPIEIIVKRAVIQ